MPTPRTRCPGFVGGNTMLRELSDDAIDRLVAFREGQRGVRAVPALPRRRIRGRAAGADRLPGAGCDVVRDGRRVRHPRSRRRREPPRDRRRRGTRSRPWAKASTATSPMTTDAAFAAKMYPPRDDGAPARGQAAVGPVERLLAQPQHPTGLTRPSGRPVSGCLRLRSRCGRPTTACGRCRACRCACRCARRRSRAGPGRERRAVAPRGDRRSTTATTRTRERGCRRSPRSRRSGATTTWARPRASTKYGAVSSTGRSGVSA